MGERQCHYMSATVCEARQGLRQAKKGFGPDRFAIYKVFRLSQFNSNYALIIQIQLIMVQEYKFN